MKRGAGGRRLSTAEAAARLGVKPATLYAYVSRGLIGRERAPDGRTSTFDPAELDRLARPGRPRRGRRPAAELIVPSALTAIHQGRISVTPLHIDLTHMPTVRELKKVLGGAPPKADG